MGDVTQRRDNGTKPRSRVTVWQRPMLMWALLLIPALVIALRHTPASAAGDFLVRYVSLAHIPKRLHTHVEGVLLVPLSAVVVSFFRLTLGLRVLGLFRPILLALAFRITGMPLGLAFLTFMLASLALVRPMLMGSHYFARMSVMLCLVASALLAPLLLPSWGLSDLLDKVAYFPVIALSLTCESFAHVHSKYGLSAAVGRTVTTTVAATVLLGLTHIHGFRPALLAYPELLIAQIGTILFIDRYLDLRLFDRRWKLSAHAPKWRVPVEDTLEGRRAL